jgi:hypothetical protein
MYKFPDAARNTMRASEMNIRALAFPLVLSAVGSCADDAGPTRVTTTVDPAIPREDPASYPKYPIVSVPPGATDARDASVEDSESADAADEATVDEGGD